MYFHSSSWDRRVVAVGACFAIGSILRFFLIEDQLVLGQDFTQVWVAGRIALDGNIATLFSVDAFTKAARGLLPVSYPISAWSYPPTTLIPAVMFACLPFVAALSVWTALKAGLLWITLRQAFGSQIGAGQTWILAITSPAFAYCALYGQFAIPVGCLLILAVLNLDRHPALSGFCVGLIAAKPQYAVLLPLLFIAVGAWRAFAWAAITVIVQVIAVTFWFGLEVWWGFIEHTVPMQLAVMNDLPAYAVVAHSVRDVLRVVHVPDLFADLTQKLVSVFVVGAAIVMFRRTRDAYLRAFVLCLSAVLVLPYTNLYDQAIPAIGAAVLYAARPNPPPLAGFALGWLWLSPYLDAFLRAHDLLVFSPFLSVAILIALVADQFQKTITFLPAEQDSAKAA